MTKSNHFKISRTLIYGFSLIFALLAGFASVSAQGSNPPNCLPEDGVIDSVSFWVHSLNVTDQNYNLHRITEPWDEHEVTWDNFPGGFDANIEGSFNVDHYGWHQADVTGLFDGWSSGNLPNHGIMLTQDSVFETMARFRTSENHSIESRPKLVVSYHTDVYSSEVVIQRSEGDAGTVWDAAIWDNWSTNNTGSAIQFYTGENSYAVNKGLVKFDLEISCPATQTAPRDAEYWKNNPDEWPLTEIPTSWGRAHSKEEAIALLNIDYRDDRALVLFKPYVAAILNVAMGTESSCIDGELDTARAGVSFMSRLSPNNLTDYWLTLDPWNGQFEGIWPEDRDYWYANYESLINSLEDYNSGLRCAQ